MMQMCVCVCVTCWAVKGESPCGGSTESHLVIILRPEQITRCVVSAVCVWLTWLCAETLILFVDQVQLLVMLCYPALPLSLSP